MQPINYRGPMRGQPRPLHGALASLAATACALIGAWLEFACVMTLREDGPIVISALAGLSGVLVLLSARAFGREAADLLRGRPIEPPPEDTTIETEA